MSLYINTGSAPVHGTSLTKKRVTELLRQIDNFDIDERALADQYNEIEEIIKILKGAELTNEADSMYILALERGIRSPPNKSGKRGDMPSSYISILTKILENILPYAKNQGGRRRKKTQRYSRRYQTRRRV